MRCPVCGEIIVLIGRTVDYRVIGSCHDAFPGPAAKVGDPATINSGSDCYPATVTALHKNGREIVLSEHEATVVKGSIFDGTAEYEYGPANSRVSVATWREADGCYRLKGANRRYGRVNIGFRRKYYDPSF